MVQLTSDCFAFGGKLTRIDEALKSIVDSLSIKTETEQIALNRALNRILAEDVIALGNVPAENNSAVDGYSIFFDDNTSKSLEKITQTYNVDLVKVKFSEDDFWNWIFLAAEKIDEPVADYAILPTLKLASIASKKYKVALTGEGGDELFGGYGRYKKSQRVFFGKKDYLPKGAFNDVLGSQKFQNWEYELKNLNSFFSIKQ